MTIGTPPHFRAGACGTKAFEAPPLRTLGQAPTPPHCGALSPWQRPVLNRTSENHHPRARISVSPSALGPVSNQTVPAISNQTPPVPFRTSPQPCVLSRTAFRSRPFSPHSVSDRVSVPTIPSAHPRNSFSPHFVSDRILIPTISTACLPDHISILTIPAHPCLWSHFNPLPLSHFNPDRPLWSCLRLHSDPDQPAFQSQPSPPHTPSQPAFQSRTSPYSDPDQPLRPPFNPDHPPSPLLQPAVRS